jgi:hypothetical protein
LGPWPRYVAEAEALLRRKEADWIFLFASGLAHDGFCWLRLALKEGPPVSVHADLRISPDLHRPLFKRVEVETDVPDGIVEDLLRLLKDVDLAVLTDVPDRRCRPSEDDWLYSDFGVDNGPCELTVLRREPWFVTSVSCNLARLTAKLSQHPAAIACRKLSDITRYLSALR